MKKSKYTLEDCRTQFERSFTERRPTYIAFIDLYLWSRYGDCLRLLAEDEEQKISSES